MLAYISRYLPLTLFLLAAPAAAQPLTGLVVGITDGDTLTLRATDRQQHQIRLAGIDAPARLQPFGPQARSNLSALIFNREVTVVDGKRDRQGRIVAKVMAADANCHDPACPRIHDVGLRQLMSGMAWWDRQYASEQTPQQRADYENAEFGAKLRRLGLWAGKNPLPPWEWRGR